MGSSFFWGVGGVVEGSEPDRNRCRSRAGAFGEEVSDLQLSLFLVAPQNTVGSSAEGLFLRGKGTRLLCLGYCLEALLVV